MPRRHISELLAGFKRVDRLFIYGAIIMLVGTYVGQFVPGVYKIFTFNGAAYDYTCAELVTVLSDTSGQLLIFYWIYKRFKTPLLISLIAQYMADLAAVVIWADFVLNPYKMEACKLIFYVAATVLFMAHLAWNNRPKN